MCFRKSLGLHIQAAGFVSSIFKATWPVALTGNLGLPLVEPISPHNGTNLNGVYIGLKLLLPFWGFTKNTGFNQTNKFRPVLH